MNKLTLRLNARYRVVVLRPEEAVAVLDEIQSFVIEHPLACEILCQMHRPVRVAGLMAGARWKPEEVVAAVNQLIGRGLIELFEDEDD